MMNRLATSSSPYLLQHADNPVDWHEWDEDALTLARTMDRPILLSIGYSACHWCHVMAHESFEDPGTAEVMNRLFVNIKVDREQRPDLDRIYQLAYQMMNRRPGGWPLTAFLDPHNHQPLFVGTYFPKAPRQGMPAFTTVLERVATWYREEPDQRERQHESFAGFFSRHAATPPATVSAEAALAGADAALERDFDADHGGFGPAPKFPQAAQLQFLLRRDDQARKMALHTLDRICRGGLLDQLGGGFYRYSVDERWEIPHFEKMLSDNGLLLATLAEAAGDDPAHLRAARLTAGWVMREMQHPEGAYYTSLDADSEGQEGAHYVWHRDAVRETLSTEEWQAAAPVFGLDRPANFEGRWHLQLLGDADLAEPLLARASATLLAVRSGRTRPALDDKVLAGWNGLMIKGMATAGRAWGEPSWVESAQAAAHFARRELWRDGRLCTSWRNGSVLHMAFLDDYAYLLDALVALVECDHDDALLEFAHGLSDCLLERFQDRDGGGFFFTADDHEQLIQRPKSFDDDATPNGNGVAALALMRLGRMTGEARYTEAAEQTVDAAVARCGDWPHAHAACLAALLERLDPRPPLCAAPGRQR